MGNAPIWLADQLHPWICPDFCNAPRAIDCDPTKTATEQLMAELSKRIIAAGEDGYFKTPDIVWWLERDDALSWRDEE